MLSISFHVLSCAEPPQMVIDTIDAIRAIKQSQDEIIILDNNHRQRECYEPVAKYCASLAKTQNVRFFHFDAIPRHKAGALNVALQLTDPRCGHILVVDSDYQLLPNARQCLVRVVNDHPDCALWQFPQAYRDGMDKPHVNAELNHYFSQRLACRPHRSRTLSTGTLALFDRQALEQIGGWHAYSLTEDAEIGLKLHRFGYATWYQHQVIGHGMLPLDVSSWMKQRQRWMYGNAQVLWQTYGLGRYCLTCPSTQLSKPADLGDMNRAQTWLQTYSHVVQLTSWLNATAFGIVLHAASLVELSWLLASSSNRCKKSDKQRFSRRLERLESRLFFIYTMYAAYLLRRWLVFHQPIPSVYNSADANADAATVPLATPSKGRAWLIHLNLWEMGAFSWMPVLFGKDKPFVVTNKASAPINTRTSQSGNTKSPLIRGYQDAKEHWQAVKELPKTVLLLNVATLGLLAISVPAGQLTKPPAQVVTPQTTSKAESKTDQSINEDANHRRNKRLIMSAALLVTGLKLAASKTLLEAFK